MGFVLYEGAEYEGSMPVMGNLRLGTSLEILRDITEGRGPRRFLFCLGYAGWAADQLEGEIARNDWLVVPADPELLFQVEPEERWERAIRCLGINPSDLSQGFGRA
jgi:putative transcriptional regulator